MSTTEKQLDYVKLTQVSTRITGKKQGLRASYKDYRQKDPNLHPLKQLMDRCNIAVEAVISDWLREDAG